MTTFVAISNSTIYDVCLNTYGTLDKLVKLMTDNNHDGVNTNPVNGQEFIYDETQSVNNGSTNLSAQYNSLTKKENNKFATQ
jgi:hypothetical protein